MQISETVRRVTVRAFGGPEQLTPDTVPEAPRVGAKELLVDVEAAGINYLDVYQRSGRYKLPLPYTPGFEGVGRVRQVGAGVSGFEVGQRVAWINALGSYASQVVVQAGQAIPMPDEFAITQALMFQSLTAQYLITVPRRTSRRPCWSTRQPAGSVCCWCNGASTSAPGWLVQHRAKPRQQPREPPEPMP